MESKDVECIRRCLAGDKEAFAAIVRRYDKIALAIAVAYIDDREAARDVAQEAFVKAYRSLKRLRNENYFAAWFTGIVKSVCIDWIRKNKGRNHGKQDRRPVMVSLDNLPGRNAESNAGTDCSGMPASDAKSPPERLAQHMRRRKVLETISTLPSTYRDVLLLKHIQGCSYAETECALGISRGTLESRLFRARAALKKELGMFFGEGEEI